jgi:hypothetical protein
MRQHLTRHGDRIIATLPEYRVALYEAGLAGCQAKADELDDLAVNPSRGWAPGGNLIRRLHLRLSTVLPFGQPRPATLSPGERGWGEGFCPARLRGKNRIGQAGIEVACREIDPNRKSKIANSKS